MLKINKELPKDKEAQLFSALGDSTRLQLINRLGGGKRNSISGLRAGMKLSRQGVTKHLRVLENAGVAKSTRVGRELHFSLQPEALIRLHEYLDVVSARWDGTIEHLRSFVEEK